MVRRSSLGLVGLVLLTNLSSFSGMAMSKAVDVSERQAVVNAAWHAVPLLYDIGFEVGYRVFYGGRNFVRASETVIGNRNLFPRPYLD